MNPWFCPISSFTMWPADRTPRRSAGQASPAARMMRFLPEAGIKTFSHAFGAHIGFVIVLLLMTIRVAASDCLPVQLASHFAPLTMCTLSAVGVAEIGNGCEPNSQVGSSGCGPSLSGNTAARRGTRHTRSSGIENRSQPANTPVDILVEPAWAGWLTRWGWKHHRPAGSSTVAPSDYDDDGGTNT